MKTRARFCVPLTVYYDKSCPMCATEMALLAERDWRGRLRLVDCSAPEFDDRAAAAEGHPRADMMARLHARDPEGRWLTGMDAFEALYGAAGLHAVARIWGEPRLRPVLDRVYPVLARNRQRMSRIGLHHIVGALLRAAARVSPSRY
jgi:predicted DCC family thiol-disulfide oxidoreductase YuxK